jgi:hypothetical protein
MSFQLRVAMQRVKHGMRFLQALGVACAGVALLAIGVAEPAVADDDAAEEAPLFYPAPPNQPRLQFLAKFSSVLDLSAKQKVIIRIGNKGTNGFVIVDAVQLVGESKKK